MISLNKFSIFIPGKRIFIHEMELETALPKSMLSIFKLVYGLNMISGWESDLHSLLTIPLENLLINNVDRSRIKYVIYVHTASWVSLHDDSVILYIKNYFSLHEARIWETNLYKCVGFFKALELLHSILLEDEMALILTGEIAFTPKLRVVPRSTIVGDAATASLFSLSGLSHRLLSVKTKFIFGYDKGIYLSDSQLIEFEKKYLSETVSVILETLASANVNLFDVAIILPHNVNLPTWRKIAELLQFPIEKIYLSNISNLAHTFCSDHLINLQSALRAGLLHSGDHYLMVGCGLGFFISAAVWRY